MTDEIIKRYKKDDVTVLWQPAKCSHTKKCWHGLPEVFNPQQRPWVKMEAAECDDIINTVNACPSGALSIENESIEEQTLL